MRWFSTLTTCHIIIMGRKTFESMGYKPLRDRVNIVLTHNADSQAPPPATDEIAKSDSSHFNSNSNCFYTSSFEDALALAALPCLCHKKIFVIGGASLYNYAVQQDVTRCRWAYITLMTSIRHNYKYYDTFFPISHVMSNWTRHLQFHPSPPTILLRGKFTSSLKEEDECEVEVEGTVALFSRF